MTPFFDREGIVLYHADCLKILETMTPGSFDLIITSPPYNIGGEPWPHLGNWKTGDAAGSKSKWRNGSDAGGGIQYRDHDDCIPWSEYVAWQQRVLSALWRIIPDNGALFYNHKPRVIGARLWTPFELIPAEVIVRQIVVWARPGGLNYNPTAFVPTHEWIMVLAKPEFRLKSKGVSGLGDVWSMTPDKNQHPAPFPAQLPRRVLQATKARVVCDPFAGSGTTAVACAQLGQRFIGMEISEEYCEMAANRIRRAQEDVESEAAFFAGGR